MAVATLLIGLMAAGLPGRLLLPEHWAELTDGLDRGLAGIQGVEWPYDGPDPWIRLTLLLGAPLLLALAATLAFWPARRAAPVLRIAGLAVLLLFYGAAVTEHDPGSALGRGLVLLLLVAAYLWLPAPSSTRGRRPAPRSWRRSACSRCRWRPSSTARAPGGTTRPGAGSARARS